MLEALDAISAAAPVLLVLEDLHWADDSTLDLLDAVLRRRDPARLIVLGTFRPAGEQASRPIAALATRPLRPRRGGVAPRRAAARGRRRRLPAAPLPGRRAAGRPRRRARPPRRRQPAVHAQPRRPLARRGRARPRRRRGAARARRGRARAGRAADAARPHPRPARRGSPPTTRSCCRPPASPAAASRSPRSPPRSGRDADAVELRCGELARRTRLIERDDGGLAFPHDLHREVLYGLLPADARAQLHARVGEHLAATEGDVPERAAELGFHFLAGRDAERAVRFLRLAAERAFTRNAHAEGIRHLRAALDAAAEVADAPERTRAEVELLSSLGQALVATDGWSAPEAEASLQRARELAARLADNEPLMSVLLALGTLYELRGEFSRAHDTAEEFQRIAPPGLRDQQLESAELLACNLFHQGSFARALEHAERGARAVRAGRRARRLQHLPGDAGRQRRRLLPRLGGARALVPRLSRPRARAGDPRARPRARPEPRLLPRHRARADRRRPPVPPRAGGGARLGRRDDRRRAGPRLLLPRGDGPRAARLGAERARRHGPGHPRDHRGARRVPRDRRAHGRPALPRRCWPTPTCARARSRPGSPPWRRRWSSPAASARCSTSRSCTASRARCSSQAGEPAAAEARLRQGLARAREQGSAALELRLATDLARLAARLRPRRRRRAAAVALAFNAFEEGHGTRDLREAARRARPRARSGDHAGAREREHQDAERDAVDDEDAIVWLASQRSRKAIDA